MVRVVIDRSNNRRFAGGGGAVVAVGGMTGVAIAAAAATPVLLVAMPLAVVAGLGVAMTGRKRAGATQREIRRVLDAVGDGTDPIRLSVDVVRRASGKATAVGSGALRTVGRLVPPPPPIPIDPIRMAPPLGRRRAAADPPPDVGDGADR